MASPLQSFPVPSSRFQHLHVDMVGPLSPSRSYTYLFTIIDKFTRWPEINPMADCTAEICAQAFLLGGLLALVCWLPSLLTEDTSSSLNFGRIFCTCSALSLLIPCHTIHKPMVWLTECIGNSKLASKQCSPHHLVYLASHHPLGHACCP